MPTAFRLKTLPEILSQMFATTRSRLGEDTDLNEGSIIRTILEAASLQDADQYIQIAKLLSLFSIFEAKGEDLDRRALDYGSQYFELMRRRAANVSSSSIIVGDGTLRLSSRLVQSEAAGATTFDVLDGSLFPIAGSTVIEEGTAREEEVVYTRSGDTFTIISPVTGFVNPHLVNGFVQTMAVSSLSDGAIGAGAGSVDLEAGTEAAWPASGTVIFERSTVRREALPFTRAGVTLTLTGTTAFAHADDTSLILSTFGSDRAVASGSQPYVPETFASARISYRVTEAGVLLDGDLASGSISVESDEAGLDTLAGANTISSWQSEPFTSATVTNPAAATGGRDRENDDEYTARLSAFVQSLSRGTPLAIETLIAGVTDPFSGVVLAFAQVVEPVAPGLSTVYITDGSTTFVIDYQLRTGRDVLISVADLSDARTRLNNLGPFKKIATPTASRTPRIFRSSERGLADLTGANFVEDSTQAWTVDEWIGFYVKLDDDQFYPITSNTAIRLTVTAGGATPSLGAYALFDFTADPLDPSGVDYEFNESNGELELVTPLLQYDALVAADDGMPAVGAYTYSRGLAAYAQRLINGDKFLVDDFPGIKSSGSKALVAAPTVVSPTYVIQVITDSGVIEIEVVAEVRSVVQAYVNTLGIGDNILLSEITRRVKSINGVRDMKILSPSANTPVADAQLARINDSNVQVV